jgi:SAM-dependent methyltransferase
MDAHEYQVMARVEEVHPWFVNRRRLVRGLVGRYAGHLAEPRVLDAGSGTGVNLGDYAGLGRAVGIELDREAAAISVGRGNERVTVGDLCRLPFPDAAFDLIISTDVIEHIDDDAAALGEMRRVLSRDGRIILTTPAYSWAYSSHDRYLHHVRRYNKGRLFGLIQQVGLRVVHASRYNVLLAAPLVVARWLGDRLARHAPNGSDVGRPVPRLAAPALNFVWRCEAYLAERVNLRVGLTHVAVLAHA